MNIPQQLELCKKKLASDAISNFKSVVTYDTKEIIEMMEALEDSQMTNCLLVAFISEIGYRVEKTEFGMRYIKQNDRSLENNNG